MKIIRSFKDWTLEQAIKYVQDNVAEGVDCPACGVYAREYPWQFYSTAAHGLICLYRLGGAEDYVFTGDLHELGYRGKGDCTRWRMFGLAEEDRKRKSATGRAGYWKLTKLGVDFIEGRATIPQTVYAVHSKPMRSEGEQRTIWQTLNKKFDYDELMGYGSVVQLREQA